MPRKDSKVNINVNDILLFKYLTDHYFLDREHIRNYIWDFYSKDYVKERLYRLINNHYLEKRNKLFNNNPKVHLLAPTEKTISALKYAKHEGMYKKMKNEFNHIKTTFIENFSNNFFEDKSSHFDTVTYSHDYNLINLRLMFEDYGFKDWKTDKYVRRAHRRENLKSGKIPDGLITAGDRLISVELECSRKSKYRYKEIMGTYSNSELYSIILYVIKDNDNLLNFLSNFITNYIDKNNVKNNFYITKFGSIKKKNYKSLFLNKKVNTFDENTNDFIKNFYKVYSKYVDGE